MSSSSIEAVLLAILTGIVGFVSYIAATRANREQAKAAGKGIDAQAFDRAKDIYLSALETARADLGATRADLGAARAELTATRADLLAARADMRETTASNERLSVEMAALRAQIKLNGSPG